MGIFSLQNLKKKRIKQKSDFLFFIFFSNNTLALWYKSVSIVDFDVSGLSWMCQNATRGALATPTPTQTWPQ
jgi:hypothetical protein